MGERLKPHWFQILLALSDQNRHGYGIQRDVLERTEGEMTLWPAMLYRALAQMSDKGWIATTDAPDDLPPDDRCQYYRMTPSGRRRLAGELARMAKWIETARKRNAIRT